MRITDKLYMQECNILHEKILNGEFGKPGDIFLTTRALAEFRHVSLVTAQKIMMELKEQQIIELIGKKNFLTYGVITQKSDIYNIRVRNKIIGLHITNIESPYFASLARNVEMVAKKFGYDVVISSSGYDLEEEKNTLQLFRKLGVSGVLSCPGRNKLITESYARYPIPFVFVSNTLEDLDIDSVVVDNANAARQVAEYLFNLGYKEFAYCAYDTLLNKTDKRLEGYSNWLTEHNISLNQDNLLYLKQGSHQTQLISEFLRKRTKGLGVFCSNDLVAMDVLGAIKDSNLNIPNDVGIVGFDDLAILSSVSTPFTTVHYRLVEMVEKAMQLLLMQIRGIVTPPKTQFIQPYLVVRQSAPKSIL